MSREKKEEKRLTHFKTMPQAAGKNLETRNNKYILLGGHGQGGKS